MRVIGRARSPPNGPGIGANEDEGAFKAKLAVIAAQRSEDEPELTKDRKGMKVASSFLLASFVLIIPATAADSQYWAVGAGLDACLTWNRSTEQETVGFIAGYWTASNSMNAQFGYSGAVGSKTDTRGIIEEVRVVCRQNPSMLLPVAIQSVYGKIIRQEGGQVANGPPP